MRFAAVVCLGVALVWFRPGPTILRGSDSGCYARIASELAARPLSAWTSLTLGGEPFHDHPPLAFWLEALAFRAFGASAQTAVGFVRVLATLLIVLIGLGGIAWGGDAEAGAAAMVALFALSGFLYESQVAMLEIPLAAATAAALVAARGAGWAFVPLVVAAFWVKGPPGLVTLAALPLVGNWRRALVLGAASLAAVALSAVLFDAVRAWQGQGPFFRTYLLEQVLPSATRGRAGPSHDPLFYWEPLKSWYLAGLIAIPGYAVVRPFLRLPDRLALLGAGVWTGVVLGFTAATQKADWYIHLSMVGAALLLGAVLTPLVRRAPAGLFFAAALAWVGYWGLTRNRAPTPEEERYLAIQSLQFPEAGGEDRLVADCSGWENTWNATHLMAFAWQARRVDCKAPAPWRFDGAHLTHVASASPARPPPL